MTESEDRGPLYEPAQARELERLDRKSPIPGGEPTCPVCDGPVHRLVEAHPAPRSDDSPFRVRLICSNCGRWTVYNW